VAFRNWGSRTGAQNAPFRYRGASTGTTVVCIFAAGECDRPPNHVHGVRRRNRLRFQHLPASDSAFTEPMHSVADQTGTIRRVSAISKRASKTFFPLISDVAGTLLLHLFYVFGSVAPIRDSDARAPRPVEFLLKTSPTRA
jgi:hypothetical protein